MYGYIYKITNTVNNKIYVGKTMRSLKQRWHEHVRCAFIYKIHRPLYDSIRYYGADKFIMEIIDTAESLYELNQKEISWISRLHCRERDVGYNIGIGGEANFTGQHHTLESRRKISEASKRQIWTDERRLKISLAQKGICNHIQTEQERLKRSQSLKLAYKEGRRTPTKGGWKTSPRTLQQRLDNSQRQLGKKWMHNDELKLNCVVFKVYQNVMLNKGWQFGKVTQYNQVKYKNLNI